MSTIAARFASVSTRAKVGAAVVGLAAVATITPAVSMAAPDIATSASIVSSVDVIEPSSLATLYLDGASSATTAITEFGAITTAGPIVTIVQFFANIVYNTAEFFIKGAEFLANEFARIFRVGPYATV